MFDNLGTVAVFIYELWFLSAVPFIKQQIHSIGLLNLSSRESPTDEKELLVKSFRFNFKISPECLFKLSCFLKFFIFI